MEGRNSWCSLFVLTMPGSPHRRQLHKQRLGGGIKDRLVHNVLRVAGSAAVVLQRQEPLEVCLPAFCQNMGTQTTFAVAVRKCCAHAHARYVTAAAS